MGYPSPGQHFAYGQTPYPSSVLSAPPAALVSYVTKRPLTVTIAAIMILGISTLILLTIVLMAFSPSSGMSLIGAVILYGLGAVAAVAAMRMLAAKKWAYSVSVSILCGFVVIWGLELFTSDLILIPGGIILILIVAGVFSAIFLLPLLLLMSKSARRWFEDGRNPSALVWAGGGYDYPGAEPFALHPSDLPKWAFRPVTPYYYPQALPVAAPGFSQAWGYGQLQMPGYLQSPYGGYPPPIR